MNAQPPFHYPRRLLRALAAMERSRSPARRRSDCLADLREALSELADGPAPSLVTSDESALLQRIDALLGYSERRLAVYGTLAPGRENHGLLADLPGSWRRGWVRGDFSPVGWGARLGHPALFWRVDGRPVPVAILDSPALPAAWERLDDFEGVAYRRTLVPVELPGRRPPEVIVANLYLAACDPPWPEP